MKKLSTILFISLLSVFFVFRFSFFVRASSFPDIKSPILLEAVNYLNEKGIIKGYPDGTFKPNQVINRAEALKIIFESRGITVEEETNSGFPDVDSNQWFAKYVTSAKKLGLINGYADGTYKPTQAVNKAEFLKISMLAQSYYQQPTSNESATSQYTDLSANEWYVPYIAFALEKDFLDKVSKLSPTAGMTRGEAALIIYRVAKHNETLVTESALESFDPKNPPPEAFTLLNPYVPSPPIPEDQVKITKKPDGTLLIQSFANNYEITLPKGFTAWGKITEPDTVNLHKGNCDNMIIAETIPKGLSLGEHLDREYVQGTEYPSTIKELPPFDDSIYLETGGLYGEFALHKKMDQNNHVIISGLIRDGSKEIGENNCLDQEFFQNNIIPLKK